MGKLKIYTICTLIINILSGCQSNKKIDADYFNGEIQYFNDSLRIIKNITSKAIPVDDYNHGFISAYDSLIILWNPKLPNHFFKIFNVDTGEEIGSFCNKGRGPNESISISPPFQFFKNGNDIMTLLRAINEEKIFLWNINQSIEAGMTVLDQNIQYKSRNEDKSLRFDNMFYQAEDVLFVRVASVPMNKDEATAPYYQKRTIYSNELLQDYHIYKKTVHNEMAAVMPVNFYYSIDIIKPDGSKIVQAMMYLPQINILDTNTGEVIGRRMQNGPGFSLFETNMQEENVYYNSIQADDNYIYATYWGKKQWDVSLGAEIPFLNTIHVFDWHGKQIYELVTDRVFFRIGLDRVRNRLYTSDLETQEVFYLDLNELEAL